MKSPTMRCFFIAVSFVLALGACKGREQAGGDGTETIAPAQPQPAQPGTDEALTETVDLQDSPRSEAEGAVLTNTAYPSDTSATTTATTSTTTAPPPTTTTQ